MNSWMLIVVSPHCLRDPRPEGPSQFGKFLREPSVAVRTSSKSSEHSSDQDIGPFRFVFSRQSRKKPVFVVKKSLVVPSN